MRAILHAITDRQVSSPSSHLSPSLLRSQNNAFLSGTYEQMSPTFFSTLKIVSSVVIMQCGRIGWLVNNELVRMYKKTVMTGMCLGELRKTTSTFSQDNRSLAWNFTPCKTEVLTAWPYILWYSWSTAALTLNQWLFVYYVYVENSYANFSQYKLKVNIMRDGGVIQLTGSTKSNFQKSSDLLLCRSDFLSSL
jgi:hypothetical protein